MSHGGSSPYPEIFEVQAYVVFCCDFATEEPGHTKGNKAANQYSGIVIY